LKAKKTVTLFWYYPSNPLEELVKTVETHPGLPDTNLY